MQRAEKESKDKQLSEKDNKSSGKRIFSIAGRIIALFGILCVTGGFIIICYQFYYWMKTGQWLAMPFSVVVSKVVSLSYLHQSEWKSAAGLLLWITNQSSALVLMISGGITAVIGNAIFLHFYMNYTELLRKGQK